MIFARHGVKPAVAMKTLSGRFWFVVFAVIVIVAVGSCCCLPVIPNIVYSVEIGNQHTGQYVKWKQPDFDNALDQVCWSRGHGHGWYEFYTDTDPTHLYKPCPAPPPTGKIRTVKVTKSKAADKIAAVEPAANDANAMYRVRSADPGDIETVLEALKK